MINAARTWVSVVYSYLVLSTNAYRIRRALQFAYRSLDDEFSPSRDTRALLRVAQVSRITGSDQYTPLLRELVSRFPEIELNRKDSVILEGWSSIRRIRPRDIALPNSGEFEILRIDSGLRRDDVAEATGNRAWRHSGFKLEARFQRLPHSISLTIGGQTPNTSPDSKFPIPFLPPEEKNCDGFLDRMYFRGGSIASAIGKLERHESVTILETFALHGRRQLARDLYTMLLHRVDMSDYSERNLVLLLDEVASFGAERLCTAIRHEVVYPPTNFTRKVLCEAPSGLHAHELTNVSVMACGLIIDQSSNVICDDPGVSFRSSFNSGIHKFVSFVDGHSTRALVNQFGNSSAPHFESAASLLGRNSSNYYHSLIEYIPRAFTLKREVPHFDGVVLANDDLPPSCKILLEQIVAPLVVVYLEPYEIATVDRLVVPDFHSAISDRPTPDWFQSSSITWWPVEQLRSFVLARCSPFSKSDKIFLGRRVDSANSRTAVNQSQLKRIAESNGYEFVDTSSMTIVEQAECFNSARRIVGPGGAAFSNLIFASEGCEVLGLVGENLRGFSAHSNLAGHFGANFRYVTGKHLYRLRWGDEFEAQLHSSFVVRPPKFRQQLLGMH